MRSFVFGSADTQALGVFVKSRGGSSLAMRDFDVYEILGRSGDYIVDNGRTKNFNINFECRCMSSAIYHAFEEAMTINEVFYKHLTANDGLDCHAYLASFEVVPLEHDVWDVSVGFSCYYPEVT